MKNVEATTLAKKKGTHIVAKLCLEDAHVGCLFILYRKEALSNKDRETCQIRFKTIKNP